MDENEKTNVVENQVVNTTSEKKKVNKVSAKKATVTAKVNKSIINSMLQKFQKNGTLKAGSKGVKSEIYKKEIFADMLPDEKKTYRRKLRRNLEGLFTSLKNATSQAQKLNVARDFWEFYSTCYSCNDFTVSSIAGGQIDENTRTVYEKYLPEFKKLLKK